MPTQNMFSMPQYQGTMWDIQRRQALAQELMKQGMESPASELPTNMPVMPRVSGGTMLGKIAQVLMANKMAGGIEGDMNSIGQQQYTGVRSNMGGSQPPQLSAGAANDAGTGNGASPTAAVQPGPVGQGAVASVSGIGPSMGTSAGGGSGPAVGTQVSTQSSIPGNSAGGSAPQGGPPRGPWNPVGMDPDLATAMVFNDPQGFFKLQGEAYAPTDMMKNVRATGSDPNSAQGRQMMQDYVTKQNFIDTHPGNYVMDPMTRQWTQMPEAPAGYQNIQGMDGRWYTVPVPGGTEAITGSTAAKGRGEAQYQLQKVWDNASQSYVMRPVSDIVGSANGGPGFSDQPRYVGQDLIDQLPDNVRAGILQNAKSGDGRFNVNYQLPNGRRISGPVDLNTLSGGQSPGGFYGGGNMGGGVSAEPPLGAVTNADATARGLVDRVNDSYKTLQGVRAGGQMALGDIDRMLQLASGKTPFAAGEGGAKFAALFGSDPAEYEKSRDNLVTNIGSQLGMGTDAARDLVKGAVPGYGAPKTAIQNGLRTLQNQINMRMLKSGYLADAYSKGDAKTYLQKENQFDQTITPDVAGIIAMPPNSARAAAIAEARKDPQKAAQLRWAYGEGILK